MKAPLKKIKRIRVLRVGLNVEFVRPVVGRLLFIFAFLRVIKVIKIDLKEYGIPKKVYCICIPKIRRKGVCNEK